jgi:drug/metabolite transporter (DMT)-like permease
MDRRTGLRPATSGERILGIWLVVVSAIFFSTAGVFSKGVSADAWTIIFWRGIFAVACGLAYLLVIGRLKTELRDFKTPAIAFSVIYASGTAAFIPAFKLTSIANVALIWSAVPVFAGALSWLVFGQRVSFGFVLACVAVIGGTFIIVYGSIGESGLMGDLLALWMTLMVVLIMMIYRRFPETPVTLPTVGASILLLPICWYFSDPLSAAPDEIALMALFGITFVIASVTLAQGSKFLSPGEAALLSVSESPWAILLAILFLARWPSSQTVIGGTIILSAVLWYQVTALRKGA